MTYDPENNYCTFSPDKLFGVKFNHACYLHDRQYRNEVKIRKTRAQADVDLKNNIFKTFSDRKKPVAGFFVSWIYYIVVRTFCERFWVRKNA